MKHIDCSSKAEIVVATVCVVLQQPKTSDSCPDCLTLLFNPLYAHFVLFSLYRQGYLRLATRVRFYLYYIDLGYLFIRSTFD